MNAMQGPPAPPRQCVHDSTRIDGTLDNRCLRCGATGYWHDGHRHDQAHPSGKVLVLLDCAASSRHQPPALGELQEPRA